MPVTRLPSNPKGGGATTVVNKQDFSTFPGTNSHLLTDAQIDPIARQLDTLCRDVED